MTSEFRIPHTFCWTKMGAEAGEDLATIIGRKEWERQLGDGCFVWGVGQSIGENARHAARTCGELPILFSPMLSRAKPIDNSPGETVIWNYWIDPAGGEHPLPRHVLVTSRASLPSGRRKSSHYALFCRSDADLRQQVGGQLAHRALRNFISDRPLGDSQVTAVVKLSNNFASGGMDRSYPVSFTASLSRPYCVRLSRPRLLTGTEVDAINRATNRAGSSDSWARLVERIRGEFSPTDNTPELFGQDSRTRKLRAA